MIKKNSLSLLVVLGIMFFISSVFANTKSNEKTKIDLSNQNKRGVYVDKNKDGVCDNYDTKVRRGNGYGYRRGRGNGYGYGRGRGNGYGYRRGRGNAGSSYVDKNKDGVCDNYDTSVNRGNGYGYRRGRGNGYGYGRGNGNGMRYNGRSFIDKDKDGICDNYKADTSVRRRRYRRNRGQRWKHRGRYKSRRMRRYYWDN